MTTSAKAKIGPSAQGSGTPTIWLNGEWCDRSTAMVSVYDHGLLYGDGVFEGIRVYGGKIFRLEEHLDRLYDSAKAIWAMEDKLWWPEGSPIKHMHGYGHYHETYQRCGDGHWRIKSLKLTRLRADTEFA